MLGWYGKVDARDENHSGLFGGVAPVPSEHTDFDPTPAFIHHTFSPAARSWCGSKHPAVREIPAYRF